MYTLRSAPCYREHELLADIDKSIRSCTESICNVCLDDHGWFQAKLPVQFGGLGIRSLLDISLPAFLSSQASSASIIRSVLNIPPEQELIDEYSEALNVWIQADLSVPSLISKQRCWDFIHCQSIVESFKPTLDQHRLACFEAASQPKSGAWLNALPSSSLGTLLDSDSLRIGVALRLGLRICESHPCRCGANIDEFGLHPL